MRNAIVLYWCRRSFSSFVSHWERAATFRSQRPSLSCLASGRKHRVDFLHVTLVAFTISFVAGLPAAAQTLTEALSYAYNNNPQLLAQRALLRATDEQVPQALSGWRPTVNFTGQAGEERAAIDHGWSDPVLQLSDATARPADHPAGLQRRSYRGSDQAGG